MGRLPEDQSIPRFEQVWWIPSKLDKLKDSKASFDGCKMLYWGVGGGVVY